MLSQQQARIILSSKYDQIGVANLRPLATLDKIMVLVYMFAVKKKKPTRNLIMLVGFYPFSLSF